MKNKFIIYFVFILLVFGCYIIPYQREIFEYHLIEQENPLDVISIDLHFYPKYSGGKLVKKENGIFYYRYSGPYWLFGEITNNDYNHVKIYPKSITIYDKYNQNVFFKDFSASPKILVHQAGITKFRLNDIALNYKDNELIFIRFELIIIKEGVEEVVSLISSFKQIIRIEEGIERGPTI